jgi:hypothetical protein
MDWYESKDRVDGGRIDMRRLSQEEFSEIMASHGLWVATEGHRGVRADLENVDLRTHRLRGV